MSLLEKIETREALVAVIGAGYVGLPLAVAFAEAGFRVVAIDSAQTRVDGINEGNSYLPDIGSDRLFALQPNLDGRRSGSLSAMTDYDILEEVDAAIVCVPTPLGKTKAPDLSHVIAVADEIARRLHPEMLVVLESTTYPGSTEELIVPRLAKSDGGALKIGQDYFVAFSPERIDPGRDDFTLENTPKVLGGVTPKCTEVARKLYETAVESVVDVSSPRVAEMVKLLENTFRATNIALVNEVAIMCDRLGVNVWEVIAAAKTKPFGFMPFYPGPGLGGHCIPVDPQYLAWKLRTLNYNARFIQLADEINLEMPAYVLRKITDALNEDGKPLKGSSVLLLGVAYKADVGDYRESPAMDLIELLLSKGANVTYHDPLVPSVDMTGFSFETVELDADALRESDCVVIVTAHSSYDWPWVVANSSLVLDTRNATGGMAPEGARVVPL